MAFLWKRKKTNNMTTTQTSSKISDSNHPVDVAAVESSRNVQQNDNTPASSLPSHYVQDRDICHNDGHDLLHPYSYRDQSVRAEPETAVLTFLIEETRHFLDQNFPWVEQLAVYLVILSVATWFLGGRSRKRGYGKRKQQHRDLEWRRCHVKRSVSTGRVHLDCNASARLGLERC